MASGCPFGGGSPTLGAATSPRPLQETNRDATAAAAAGGKLPTGRARVRLLYEEYVHLPLLCQVWESPSTERPVLEPLFAAGFHGIELAFLLLAEFLSDSRGYVAKRPRVELVADDIAAQCRLLTEVVDAELEEELAEGEGTTSRLSLTQPFPFEGCPPTKAEPCHSPGLRRLTEAVQAKLGGMSTAERNSLVKLVINITAAFNSFQRWTVGLGIEHQLQDLQAAVGLAPTQYPHRPNLDYASLVRPWLCEQTLTCEVYTNKEDYFFRSIHLGTDCWAFVALARLASARQQAEAGNWHVAAARATQAARILDYLGSHVLMLTSMNLRDYLQLKVELEGTSGEGSVQVKALRGTVAQLLEPLEAALLGPAAPAATSAVAAGAGGALPAPAAEGESEGCDAEGGRQEALQQALMAVYEFPDRSPGLYNYARALEVLETGLLGGFYYKHYCLATNVIGSEARGTMRRAVQALKAGYETLVFPQLDRCRVALGARLDAELADRKGRIMHDILARVAAGQAAAGGPVAAAAGQATAGRPTGEQAAPVSHAGALPSPAGGGCPFAGDSAKSAAAVSSVAADTAGPAAHGAVAVDGEAGFEAARRKLYSWQGVPPAWQAEVTAELAHQAQQLGLTPSPAGEVPAGSGLAKPLAFLDHAWGQLAPLAQCRAWREAAALYQLGNPAWEALFGRIMPQAAAHIKSLLGLPPGSPACSVQFGSNSHELVLRLLSTLLDARRRQGSSRATPCPGSSTAGTGNSTADGGSARLPVMRVLASDCEFYSIARQLNRLIEAGLAEVEAVACEPADTFPERCCAAVAAAAVAGHPFDAVYISQITYLTQRTLIPDIPALVGSLRAAASAGPSAAAVPLGGALQQSSLLAEGEGAGEAAEELLIIIDGYHGFCAVPTNLGEAAQDCCYVAGLLKHAGCGANCAFLTLPAHLAARPVLTGWLADPYILAPDSPASIQLGSEVGYTPGLALQGGTPAYLLPLLVFNHLMQLWREASPSITVEALHAHVLGLHTRLLAGLGAAGHPHIKPATLLPPQDPARRSHTLVFRAPSAAIGAAVVKALAARGVLIDKRGAHVRLGFGPDHSAADVDALLAALRAAAAATDS
ncbi:hypothetical protein ABPG75_009523 [Micractinium tetrahymenae]